MAHIRKRRMAGKPQVSWRDHPSGGDRSKTFLQRKRCLRLSRPPLAASRSSVVAEMRRDLSTAFILDAHSRKPGLKDRAGTPPCITPWAKTRSRSWGMLMFAFPSIENSYTRRCF